MERSFRAFVLPFLLLVSVALPAGADCTAGTCVDCEQPENKPASCVAVSQNANCECRLDVNFPEFCILEGECTYSGGAGTGGGGGGGGGSTCYQLPGSWCPAECTSCETIFWY
jgi:hypothetical protein